MFEGRKLLIATKHEKEKVIAPLLEAELGVQFIIPEDFDTDVFGTFSGEIERTNSPIDTARLKCSTAMNRYGYDLAIASEGSFGSHPSLFFLPANEEFLILIDHKNNLEIIARELSDETNFSGEEIHSLEQLNKFCQQAQFPSHGVILKDKRDDFNEAIKGILNYAQLVQAYSNLKEKYGCVYMETDMRAHVNPTRMKVIEVATHKLITKIKSTCPSCNAPGFDVTEVVTGLPCSYCGEPTRAVLKLIYQCKHCANQKELHHPLGIPTEDPSRCDLCNP